MFLNFFRNILRPQQMFPRLHGKEAKKLFCFPVVCSPWKHYEQQRFRNNLSSFAGAFKHTRKSEAKMIYGTLDLKRKQFPRTLADKYTVLSLRSETSCKGIGISLGFIFYPK